jgi:hypothetical protein
MNGNYCFALVSTAFIFFEYEFWSLLLQVNTLAAEKLYSLAGDWACLGPDTLLFDVCCGTGAIGLTLAHRVGMVIITILFRKFIIQYAPLVVLCDVVVTFALVEKKKALQFNSLFSKVFLLFFFGFALRRYVLGSLR